MMYLNVLVFYRVSAILNIIYFLVFKGMFFVLAIQIDMFCDLLVKEYASTSEVIQTFGNSQRMLQRRFQGIVNNFSTYYLK